MINYTLNESITKKKSILWPRLIFSTHASIRRALIRSSDFHFHYKAKTGSSFNFLRIHRFVYFQWAKIIMSIERSVPPDTAKSYLEEYSIKLSKTERGVMVIKTKDKTRASQRKGALSNWKVKHCCT